MKEMNSINIKKGETSMKKTLVILVLAFALVLALGATPAHAKYAGFSAAGTFVDWSVAQSMASQNADAALMASGPHKGYATTTIKCAVCHSVHRGENKLLSGGGGCAYCHTTAYYGGAAFAKTISWSVTPADAGPHSTCASSYCHGGPHGVGASSYAGPASKLLVAAADAQTLSNALGNGLTEASLATYDANTRVVATGGVCGRTGCHVDSMFAEITGSATQTIDGVANVQGHRVIAAASANWNAGGFNPNVGNVDAAGNPITVAIATKTGTIAWKPVEYCNSCHDLTDDNNGGATAFPHAINQVVSVAQGKVNGVRSAIWLTAGPDADTQTTAVSSYNDYIGGATIDTAAGSSVIDGTCLKCHRGSGAGVGVTF